MLEQSHASAQRLVHLLADAEGRALFQSWCEAAGMTMALDRMGNMFMRLEGADPDAGSPSARATAQMFGHEGLLER